MIKLNVLFPSFSSNSIKQNKDANSSSRNNSEKLCILNSNTKDVFYIKPKSFTGTISELKLKQQLPNDFLKKNGEIGVKNITNEISFKGGSINEAFKSIEFVPAKTLDEAEKYAIEDLGLQSVDYQKNLSMANWTNEAFTALVNKFKGKHYLPYSLNVKPYEVIGNEVCENTLGFQSSGNVIVYSKAIENAALQNLEKLSKYWCLDYSNKGIRNFLCSLYPKEVIQKIDNILTNCLKTKEVDLKSGLIVYDFKKDFDKLLNEFSDNPKVIFAKIFKNLNENDMLKITTDDNLHIVNLRENYGKSNEETERASNILTKQINKFLSGNLVECDDNMAFLKTMGDALGEKQLFLSNINTLDKMSKSFDIVFHECGHWAHEKYHPQKSYDLMRYERSYQGYFSKYKDKVKYLLSDRASLNPEEYLAERFKFKARGIEFNDPDIDELDQFLEAE